MLGETLGELGTGGAVTGSSLRPRTASVDTGGAACEPTSDQPAAEETSPPSDGSGETLLTGCAGDLLPGLRDVAAKATLGDRDTQRTAGTPEQGQLVASGACGDCGWPNSCLADHCYFCSDSVVAGCSSYGSATCDGSHYCERATGTYSCRNPFQTNKVVGRC